MNMNLVGVDPDTFWIAKNNIPGEPRLIQGNPIAFERDKERAAERVERRMASDIAYVRRELTRGR